MKHIIKHTALAAIAVMSLASCNDFLDKLPDDRAELNTTEKITQLGVNCYSTSNSNIICELLSDNILDNGKKYSTVEFMEQLYRMLPVTTDGNDTPKHFWNGQYEAIASCNQLLEAVAEMPEAEQKAMSAQVAEATLCRAYAMFELANTFCMAYNPDKAAEYMGLPYPTHSGIDPEIERGTIGELYEKIDADIEAALPGINEAIYKTPKYHFNQRAAYSFAAKFNLYYMRYDKAIAYATKALGDNPANLMRNYEEYLPFGRTDIANKYVLSSEKANFMLQGTYSTAGRYLSGGSSPRFHHNSPAASYETYWVDAPWGSGSYADANTLHYSHKLYGNNQAVSFPKLDEKFEITDKVNQTGYAHIVEPVFTADETVLIRAEARLLNKDYQGAIDDMNLWVQNHCSETADGAFPRPVLTPNSVNTFIDKLDYAEITPEGNRDRSLRKPMTPQGFALETGMQENIAQLLLHMKRLEMLYQGERVMDIKRYGIEFSHLVDGEDPIVIAPGDIRLAAQLPTDVITAGVVPNPRPEGERGGDTPEE